MHIPDGFISAPINGAAALISMAAIGYSVMRIKRDFQDTAFAVPLLATMAAFVFAAQMLNFPIGGGTSGHFLGAVTAAALLGPWSACLILSIVLVLQGFFFGDGGVSALGTNIFNMGVIGGVLGFAMMRGIRSVLPSGRIPYLFSVALASWLSLLGASFACALELVLSGTSPFAVAVPAMLGVHAVIGVGEALIAVAVITSVTSARPDLLPSWARIEKKETIPPKNRKLAFAGLLVALWLATVGSPFASSSPDGLEKVAEEKGFLEAASKEKVVWTKSPFPDYQVPFVASEQVSTGVAGLIGTMLVFALGFGVIRLAARPRPME